MELTREAKEFRPILRKNELEDILEAQSMLRIEILRQS
jgi:hypothetical protein